MDIRTIEDIRMTIEEFKAGDVDVFSVLDRIVDKLDEIEKKFNNHGHRVDTKEATEYESAGGFTSSPKTAGSFGCHEDVVIGR